VQKNAEKRDAFGIPLQLVEKAQLRLGFFTFM
jgi:hypothetical protein